MNALRQIMQVLAIFVAVCTPMAAVLVAGAVFWLSLQLDQPRELELFATAVHYDGDGNCGCVHHLSAAPIDRSQVRYGDRDGVPGIHQAVCLDCRSYCQRVRHSANRGDSGRDYRANAVIRRPLPQAGRRQFQGTQHKTNNSPTIRLSEPELLWASARQVSSLTIGAKPKYRTRNKMMPMSCIAPPWSND